MARLARGYRDGGGAPPTGYPGPSPAFRGAVAAGRGGGFSRARCADTRVPVRPIPPLGTPTPTDWPPTGTGLPLPTGHLRPLTD